MFSLDAFIRESNRIDPQPTRNSHGRVTVIPGDKPGDPLYDRHIDALETAASLMHDGKPPPTIACDVHRQLTRGIEFFERRNGSGQYRRCGICVGSYVAPPPDLVRVLVERRWYPALVRLLKVQRSSQDEVYRDAWWLHDCYESIHPFIDGNGRSGRVLLNAFLQVKGCEQLVIRYDDRYRYYAHIQRFEQTVFPAVLKGDPSGFRA
jgi:fido (protein-threonine AMPylation protein)